MKKHGMKVFFAVVAVLLLSMAVLVGCGDSTPENLTGTRWDVSAVKVDGQEVDARSWMAQQGYPEGSVISLEFSEDKASMKISGETITKNYTYETGQGTMDNTGNVENDEMPFTVSGNTMWVTIGNGEMTFQRTDNAEG